MARTAVSGRTTSTRTVPVGATRNNIRVSVNSYAGTGVQQDITGLGFRPDVVMIKGGANVMVWRTNSMIGDSTGSFGSGIVNFTGGVITLLNDGFTVGTNATTNANGTTYYYVAMSGTTSQQNLFIGRYKGLTGDDRNYTGGGFSFTPDLVLIKGDVANNGVFRTSTQVGDVNSSLSNAADTSNQIQSIISNGWQLGTSGNVNTNASTYHFMVAKSNDNFFAQGQYTGTGVARTITVPFQPSFVFIKSASAATSAVITTSAFPAGDSAVTTASAPTTGQITALNSSGFNVGTVSVVNSNGTVYNWFAFKAGVINVPINRTAV